MNIVEEYLTENKGVKLSVRSLSKKLDIPIKQAYFLVCNSKLIRKVDPLEVGSMSYRINVYTAI